MLIDLASYDIVKAVEVISYNIMHQVCAELLSGREAAGRHVVGRDYETPQEAGGICPSSSCHM
jgi:hypothetical protein